jgi:ubiquinone/menaquinone biosynthesis C-methylase UbiE
LAKDSGVAVDFLATAMMFSLAAGNAYGLDMTDEMLALARDNQRKAGATNVEILKVQIEAIPHPTVLST